MIKRRRTDLFFGPVPFDQFEINFLTVREIYEPRRTDLIAGVFKELDLEFPFPGCPY